MKKIAKYYLVAEIAVALVAVIFFAWGYFNSNPETNLNAIKKSTVTISGSVFDIDIASTEAQRQKGLSGREKLEDNQAMLFIFNRPDRHSFWMKDMLIPIDIVWLDISKRVVYIERNVSPSTYPEGFKPDTNALYVLEFTSGTAQRINMKVGDLADFSL